MATVQRMNDPAGAPPEGVEEPVAVPMRRPGIGTHYLRYSFSNGMVLLAGFISFPILTRLLDNTQFGILRYYDTLMLLGVAIAKLGTPHAIVRFYPYDGDVAQMRVFGTNLVALPLILSCALWGLFVAGLTLWSWAGGRPVGPLVWCAVAMIPLMASISIVQMVVRAGERSDIVMTTRIAGRMLELLLVIGAVVWVQQSALAVYGGKIAAAVLLLAWLASWLRRNVQVARDAIDLAAFRAALVFSLPLMANEIAFSILANMDRVLLKHLTGDFAAVGIYAIGYGLAMHLNVFIDVTLSEAFTPVVTRVYETGGGRAVRALKERVLLPMTYAVIAIVGLLLVAGPDLLVALSGPDKAASGEVFVVVGITVSLYAWFAIGNYGLQLKERTVLVLMLTLGAALLNIVMNFILVPRMGYIGAAWSTVIGYGALSAAQFATCPKGLAKLPDFRAVATALVCLALFLTVTTTSELLAAQGPWSRLCVAGGLFVLLYAVPVLLLDSRIRAMLPWLRKPF